MTAPTDDFLGLAKIVARVDVFGFEFTNGDDAYEAWQTTAAMIDELMPEDPPDEAAGASIWRTKDAATESRWFVLVVDDGLGLRDRGAWGAGVPYAIEGNNRRSLVERHLRQMLDPQKKGPYTAHYGLGAELRRGGDLRIRIGGENG